MALRQAALPSAVLILAGAVLILAGCGSAVPAARPVAMPPSTTAASLPPGAHPRARGQSTTTAVATTSTAVTTPESTASTTSTVSSASTASTTSAAIPPASTTFAPTSLSVQPPSAAVPACPATAASGLAWTGQAAQLVMVEAPTYSGSTASLTRWQRSGPCWTEVGSPWVAQIAWNGFSDDHHEGDNTTPTGAYDVGPVMYGTAPDPGVAYPYHQLVCGDWWDEEPASPGYNTFQHVACGAEPSFGGASEPLWEEGNAYPSFAVIGYNTDPIVPGAGSGIFLHANIGTPTDGCVSLPLDQLDQVLDWLSPSADPLIVLGPASEIERF